MKFAIILFALSILSPVVHALEDKAIDVTRINKKDDMGTTPLILAIKAGSYSAVERLLKNGADPNLISDGDGCTPLIHAVMSNMDVHDMAATVKLLIKSGAKVNGTVQMPKMPLGDALSVGTTALFVCPALEITYCLLQNGADIHHKDSNGMDALATAIAYGDFPKAEQLIEAGANAKQRDELGRTFLMQLNSVAIESGLEEAEKFIILLKAQGLDINDVDNKGQSALHIICSVYHCDHLTPLAGLLIKHGAKVDIKDKQGKTAYDIVKANKNAKTLPALLLKQQ